MSPNTFCEGPQKSSIIFPLPEGSGFLSGRTPFMMHTASITSLTSAGGFCVFVWGVLGVWVVTGGHMKEKSVAGECVCY